MQNSSKKNLIIGIVASVLILAALVAVVLTQCAPAPSQSGQTTAPAPTQQTVAERCDLYWNLDRAEYEGKSEAGMSSRMPDDDGYFRVRLFKDGAVVEVKVSDRRVINTMDVNDLMGLEFDENGIVTGIIQLDDMPIEKLSWQFYVQSAGGNLIKTNSSPGGNGMEVMLETDENTGIWDMTGLSGDPGCPAQPCKMDRVLAVGDQQGRVTHVFIFDRPNYMRTHEGDCQHCGKTVTWYEWTQEKYLPTTEGHYQLMNDIQLASQASIAEDAKICLDLNGKTVTGKKNTRIYSLHNPGVELALMDTSEAKSGKLVAVGKSSSQGVCVWVRYGVFHLYGGTLDASQYVSKNNGISAHVSKNTYMYMHGGEIIGGTATYSYNADTGKYGAGLGGSLYVAGKLVVNGGIIRNGYAQARITAYNTDGTPKTYQRGMGGNVFIAGTGVVEINGGTIQNGRSDGAGGNIYIDGAGELTVNGGTITGGRTLGKSRSGGNIIGYSKAIINIRGGVIENGRSTYRGGNIYTTGRLTISDGSIRGGKLTDYKTSKSLKDLSSRNIYFSNNTMAMYGGSVDGGVFVVDSSAAADDTWLVLSAYATIYGNKAPNLTVATGGGGVKVTVATLYDRAKIGISTAAGIFSQPTKEENLDNFISDLPGADVLYVDGRLALGRYGCLCGSNSKNAADHLGDCKEAGIQTLFWGPVTSTTSLPSTTGNYYLLHDVNCTSQTSLAENADMKLDLNGFTITGPENFRTISVHYSGASLVICDSSEGKTGVIRSHGVGSSQGNVVWSRYGSFDLYGGTLDGSAYTYTDGWNEGKDGIFGTADDTISSRDGGTLCMGSGSTTMRMFAGTVIGNNAAAVTQTKTVDGKEVSFKTTSPGGASLYVPAGCAFEMYGGTIRDGISEDYGGNVLLAGTMIIDGGQILDGICTYNGGNINTKDGSHLELHSGAITGGWGKNVTGNLHCSGTFTMTGGEITGGKVGKTPSATSTHADIQFVNGDMVYTGGKLGNIQLTNSGTNGTEGGCVVNLSGKLDIAAIKLATYDSNTKDDKIPSMPILEIGGALKSAAVIPVTPSNSAADFAIGKDYALTPADATVFILSDSTVTAASDTTTNSLFFGRMACLCGKTSHTKGCQDLWGGAQKRWTRWTSTESLPIDGGNYYLIAPVTLKSGVQNLKENANVVLDLNGYTVTGKANNRMYATFGTGSNLTITDTSSAQTGKLVGTGTAFDGVKSCCIWLRYGTLNLLGGTLDGSAAQLRNSWESSKVSEKNGGVICAEKNTTINIYGGTIKGAQCVATTSGDNAVYAPNGGALYIAGTLNMYGGTVKGGSTERYGGNLYLSGTANLYGGTMEGGSAMDGGNIYALSGSTLNVHEGFVIEDGNATKYGGNLRLYGTLNLQGGAIQNGTCALNGGNIYSNSGSVINMTSGSITGGWGKSQTGNIHCCGTLNMSGGSITGGKTDSSGITTAVGRDIAFVNGTLNYTGGRLDSLRGTNYNSDGREGGCVLNLGGTLDIGAISLGSYDDKDDDGNTPTAPLLNITGAVSGSVSYIATAEGIFAQGSGYTLTDSDANAFTTELNLSGLPGGILREDNTLAVRAYSCLCGKSKHTKGCLDLWGGEKRVWTAWTSTNTLPTTTGNYYLTADVSLSSKGVQKLAANANVVLDLNGFTVTGKTNDRMYATHNEGSNLTITDNSQAQTGKMVGVGNDFAGKSCCIWIRYGTLNILGGTFDGSGTTIHNAWESNKLAEKNGGVICLEKNRTFNMYGGTIIGAKAVKTTVDGNELYAPMGASIYLPSGAVMNMYAGTVKGGNTEKNGGNLYIYGGTLNMHGGVIETGEADDCGGNLFVRGGTVNMDGGVIKNGTRNGVAANLTANFAFTNGGTLNISGGEIHGRLNLGTTVASSDTKTGTVNISGSAKIYSPTAANPVANNNLSATLTVNIGKLNDDAMIGLQVSSTGKPLTSEKLLASYSDEESLQKALTDGRIGISVYMSGDTYNRTYAFVTRDGKLYVYQTSATAK